MGLIVAVVLEKKLAGLQLGLSGTVALEGFDQGYLSIGIERIRGWWPSSVARF